MLKWTERRVAERRYRKRCSILARDDIGQCCLLIISIDRQTNNMPAKLTDLPYELCFQISLYTADPASLSLTNRAFHALVHSPMFNALYFLCHYGRPYALFTAIRDHPSCLTPPVIH